MAKDNAENTQGSPETHISQILGLKIGIGEDVHKLVPGRKLILGGVSIPFEKGLLGHSDADVLTHAVCDALLGAARLGDIGKLFPDTSDTWAGADSIHLLSIVQDHVVSAGYRILDVDSVVVAQRPKISPYRDQMRQHLADAMGIDISCVGMKATTSEGLGFEGRQEGISARAVALLQKTSSTIRQ